MMRVRVALLCLLILALACPRGRSRTAAEITIEDLRARAAAHPDDPAALHAVAVGEILRDDGDPARAAAAISAALRRSPDDASLHLLAGLEAEIHGHPTRALDAFVTAVEKAAGTAPAIAEVAAEAIALTHMTADVRARLEAVAPSLGPAARQTVHDKLITLAYRAGDMELVRRLAARAGCLTEWRVAGPFGPRALLGFDEHHAAGDVGPMAATYDLGPLRGTRPTREVEARGCAVHLGGGPIAAGGTTYAEAFVEVPAGPYTLRLETPNAVELSVDGSPVVRLDHRRLPLRRVTFHTLELTAGRHEIGVKISTRHPNPILQVSLTAGMAETAVPEGEDVLTRYLQAAARFSRGDTVGARQALLPFGDGPGSPMVRILQSAVALADPLVPAQTRRDNARRMLRAILDKDDQAWFPVLQLARLKAAEGRDQEAIADLRAAAGRWPELSTLRLALAEFLLNRGWDAEAAEHIENSLRIAPNSCGPIAAALTLARRRDRVREIDRWVEASMRCDARSSERFQLLLSQRKWAEASAELDRLANLEPRQSRVNLLSSRLSLAEGRADPEAVEAILQELQQLNPQSARVRLERADLRLAQNQRDDALRLLTEALAEEPAAMADLRRVRTALGGGFEFDGYRVDGAEVIDNYEASGRQYAQPQVLVLDYTVVRVFDDLSSMALTHQIYKVQSEEAVDSQGEFSPPAGATILQLHTIKPDGTRLEPDRIEGKETISLPNLAVGDYVEYEYVRLLDPPSGLPGGLLGDRFYFASFELPFDRSEMVLLLPQGVEARIDPRGAAPETQESRDGDLRVLRWRVDQSRPLVQEPASVASREYIPSINWGIHATWGRFLGGLRDVLADRNIVDPSALQLAQRVVGNATSDQEKARRLYYWLLDNVENDNNVFGQAAEMLAGHTGNRTRILHYLLGLLQVPSKLVLVRGFGADQTRSEVADEDTYSNLLVMLGEGDDATYVQLSARGVPFGYISPALRGQDGLVLTPAQHEEEVVHIEVPPASGEEDSRRIEIMADVAADGSATVQVVETFRGHEAIQWRSDLEGVPEAMIEQRFEEAYVARLLNGGTLESLTITGREEAEQPLVLRYTARVPTLARQEGSGFVLPGLYPMMLTPRFARVAERTTTQIVGPPLHLDIVIRVRTPDGAPRTPLPALSLEAAGARFQMRATVEQDYLQIERRLDVPLLRVAPDAYGRWAAFCHAVDEAESREIPLQ